MDQTVASGRLSVAESASTVDRTMENGFLTHRMDHRKDAKHHQSSHCTPSSTPIGYQASFKISKVRTQTSNGHQCQQRVKSFSKKTQGDGKGVADASNSNYSKEGSKGNSVDDSRLLLDGTSEINQASRIRSNLGLARRPSDLLLCPSLHPLELPRSEPSRLSTPDRFIPLRPPRNKDALLQLPRSRTELIQQTMKGIEDPFASADDYASVAREQQVAFRHPIMLARPFGFVSSHVGDNLNQRNASIGTIWTVGRTAVTEGVASTPNGRGGRITSGSCAAHYTADFLRRRSSSENNAILSQRLAVAMDLDIGGKVLEHSSPSSAGGSSNSTPSSGAKTVFRNGRWENDSKISPCKSKPKPRKKIPATPFRVLDAPSLRDDYYCSLLAYSSTLHSLAVGLGAHVYLWSESPPDDMTNSLVVPFTAHITTISFSSPEGGHAILAVGRADGRITLWSPLDTDPRFDSEQPAPVSCLVFRPTSVRRPSANGSGAMVGTEELLVGDEIGNVYFYSIEWSSLDERDLFDWDGCMTLLARISCHNQQICGIAWRPDGEAFATGGNDNQLFLFETKKILDRRRTHSTSTHNHNVNNSNSIRVRNNTRHQRNSSSSPSIPDNNNDNDGSTEQPPLSISLGQQKHLWTLNAAVKAIAFAPWQPTLLAAGGGSNDRCIRFFHTLSGASLATIDCHAQVTSLVFSPWRRELIATFGFAQPEHLVRVGVFAWPSCRTVGSVPWHGGERALWAVAYNGSINGNGRGSMNRDEDAAQDELGRGKRGSRKSDVAALVVAGSDGSIKFHEVF